MSFNCLDDLSLKEIARDSSEMGNRVSLSLSPVEKAEEASEILQSADPSLIIKLHVCPIHISNSSSRIFFFKKKIGGT